MKMKMKIERDIWKVWKLTQTGFLCPCKHPYSVAFLEHTNG